MRTGIRGFIFGWFAVELCGGGTVACASTNAFSVVEFEVGRVSIFWLGTMPIGKAVFLR
jgi:hypothetical protein